MGGNLWIRHPLAIVTGRPEDPVRMGVELVIENGVITYLGPRDGEFEKSLLPRREKFDVLDADGCVVYPGLVNTHHHMYQAITRNHPRVERLGLFDWLKRLFPVWASVTEEITYYASLLVMAELVKSGCTATMDHHYVFPKGQLGCLDRQFEAAQRIGIRFHGSRGSMSVGQSRGGLPQDSLVEDPDTVLSESERLIREYHDPSPFSMRQIVLSPCAPTSVDAALFRETADLARRYGVRLHTHLAETPDEVEYSRERFGRTPVEYMDELGWLGPDVWFAHAIHLDEADIRRLAAAGAGVAHCASSNMKLHSGICNVRCMYETGVPVGIGVDGSASNDSSNLLAEVRTAYLLQWG
ncbi:MAG: amidohydrolase family protein [Kyrpidia sp.]|nr:amidohydrolase family protein [Kyrpidia sp.]